MLTAVYGRRSHRDALSLTCVPASEPNIDDPTAIQRQVVVCP
jgi:hypothetical protein